MANPQATCKLFLSDCHISAGWGLEGSDKAKPHPWEWFSAADQARLKAFLAWAGQRPDIDEFVLLGDIWDNWIFPHDIKPPTFSELLLSANAAFFVQALNGLCKNSSVIWVPGNHDLTISAAVLNSVLPGVIVAGPGQANPYFSWGRLRAEHGHSHCLFNAPDPLRPGELPLGYFVSRIVATADRQTGNHTPSIAQEVSEIEKVIANKEDLAQGVLDAVCAKAGVGQDAVIQMPNDLWGGVATTVGYVRNLYKNLYQEWENRNGTGSALVAIAAELNQLSAIAIKIFLQGGVNAMVMGHTHEATTDQYSTVLFGNRIYANTGGWCNNVPTACWAEAVKSPNGGLTLTVYGCKGVDSSGKPIVAQLLAPVQT
jgi:UDP-2,3-diacylglucosamine pyrophosphatase LpxH